MIQQITNHQNNVVTGASIGGFIPGGIDVEEIPEEVMSCPSKWLYKDGNFKENPDYIQPEEKVVPTIEELTKENELMKVQIEAQSEQMDFYEDCIAEMASVSYA